MDAAKEFNTSTPRPIFQKRTAKSTARKRPATPPPESDSSESGYTSGEGEGGQRIKRRKKSAVVNASSTSTSKPTKTTDLSASTFAADRTAKISETNDATKQSNWFDETDAAQLLGSSRQKKSDTSASVANGDGTYKGAAAYSNYLPQNPDKARKASSKTVGPVKAPANVRTITVLDFAPDVCKDYKQTGFCGFGDSCKFLHAREDYKQGWQLDRDWEIGKDKKKDASKSGGDEDNEEKILKTIPFACIICKQPYKNPIVTKCGHYFCEACALGRYKKSPSCAACGAGTNGVFNGAKQLNKLLEKKRERARERRRKARENGEEAGSTEDEDEQLEGEKT